MALIWIQGFDSFGTSNTPVGLTNCFASTSGMQQAAIDAGRYNGYSLKTKSNGSTQGEIITATSLFSAATLIIGFAFKVDALPSSSSLQLFALLEGADHNVGCELTSTGAITVSRVGGGAVLETSSAGLVDPNKWYYLEAKLFASNTGTWDVHLDGVQILNGSGDTLHGSTGNNNALKLYGGRALGGESFLWFDDLYIADTTGGIHDDFLGEQNVVTIFPNATGNSAQFTSSGGDNYAAVDDNGHDTDSTYVEDDTPGQTDLYNFGNVGPVSDVKGVQVNAVCRKTDASAFDIVMTTDSGGTPADGTAVTIDSSSYITAKHIFTVDPDTTAAWTEAGLNAAQFGYKVG